MGDICQAVTVWPEIRPHGARLVCCLPAGHVGDHACADIEYQRRIAHQRHVGTAFVRAESRRVRAELGLPEDAS